MSNIWPKRSLQSYILSTCDNFKPNLQQQKQKTNEDLQNVSDYRNFNCMLLNPPKSKLAQQRRVELKFSHKQNGHNW